MASPAACLAQVLAVHLVTVEGFPHFLCHTQICLACQVQCVTGPLLLVMALGLVHIALF